MIRDFLYSLWWQLLGRFCKNDYGTDNDDCWVCRGGSVFCRRMPLAEFAGRQARPWF